MRCVGWLLAGGLALAQAPLVEYGGPAILARSGAPALRGGEEFLRLRPFITVGGVYDTGLTGVLTDPSGRIPSTEAYGVQVGLGALGYHAWKHTTLGLHYRGNFQRYSRETYYDGMDNALSLVLGHQASRRISFELTESAAAYRAGFYGLSGYRFFDPTVTDLAQNTLFDHRTVILASAGRMVFQKSPRLSFAMGGVGMYMDPRSRALADVRGVQAAGDISYRVSRFHTTGVDYQFQHYGFPGAFGSADAHGVALNHAVQLNRSWTLSLRAGGFRVETLRLQQVAIDPVIARIIGQSVGIEAFHRIIYTPQYGASLVGSFRRSHFEARYHRGITPGNGLYLTSGMESASISYGRTGLRRIHIAGSIGYSRFTSFSQSLGRYRNYYAGGGITYRLSRLLSAQARIDGRKYNLQGTGFGRIYYRASAGLAFAPGDFPLALW